MLVDQTGQTVLLHRLLSTAAMDYVLAAPPVVTPEHYDQLERARKEWEEKQQQREEGGDSGEGDGDNEYLVESDDDELPFACLIC